MRAVDKAGPGMICFDLVLSPLFFCFGKGAEIPVLLYDVFFQVFPKQFTWFIGTFFHDPQQLTHCSFFAIFRFCLISVRSLQC